MTDVTVKERNRLEPANEWYEACRKVAANIRKTIPEPYTSRTFSGILGDIKALPPKKALSLISRKKGLGSRYAYLYVRYGIDGGRGYQACAVEALFSLLGARKNEIIKGRVLDVGCAVGVTAGILKLEHVTGFDLFVDLLGAARSVDSLTGRVNNYITADMTQDWPFGTFFDTVVCGLVCHHLKTQTEVAAFFSNAHRVLKQHGSLIMTLPSGSISKTSDLLDLFDALENFGFEVNRELSGLVVSTDSSHSLFWMFLIIAGKVSEKKGTVFIHPDFGFPLFRTPVTREQKGAQARETVTKKRMVRHEHFKLLSAVELERNAFDTILDYSTVVLL